MRASIDREALAGLAITREVARLHGEAVQAKNGHPHGLIVEMELPLASAQRMGSATNRG